MTTIRSLPERAALLLGSTRFFTLASVGEDGHPWASTVCHVLLAEPRPRLLWYSMRTARHSRNIDAHAHVAGSIFRADLTPEQSPLLLDGLQIEGEARAMADTEAERDHRLYYLANFPDESVRRQWMLPLEQFVGAGPRRFYELVIERWWLFDLERWLDDKCDARIALPPPGDLVRTLRLGVPGAS